MSEEHLSLEHRYYQGAATAPVLLALHGTGGGPDDLLGLAGEVSSESGVLAPQGQVSEQGATRWFRRHEEGVFDTDDVIARADELANFVDQARRHYELQGRRVVALGFSNGANIGAALALLRPDVLREAILFAPMLPVPEPPSKDLRRTRVFMSNGERDAWAPLDSAKRLVTAFEERGADVQWNRHLGGHQITPLAVGEAREWLEVADAA